METLNVKGAVLRRALETSSSCLYKSAAFIEVFKHLLFIGNRVRAHNGVVHISVPSGFKVVEPFYVPGQPLINFSNHFGDKLVKIDITDDLSKMTMVCGRSRMVLSCEDVSVHKPVPIPRFNSDTQVTLQSVGRVIPQLVSSLGRSPHTLEEMGICVRPCPDDPGFLYLCSTDRYSASRHKVSFVCENEKYAKKFIKEITDRSIVMPIELCSVLNSVGFDNLVFSLTDGGMLFQMDGGVIIYSSVLQSEGRVNFDEIFSRASGAELQAAPKGLRDHLENCKAFDDSASSIDLKDTKIVVKDGKLISTQAATYGEVKHVCTFRHPDMSMVFDHTRMLRGLENMNTQIGFINHMFVARSEGFEYLLSDRS